VRAARAARVARAKRAARADAIHPSRSAFLSGAHARHSWLVLEPWITPSLFYQFLGAPERYKDETPQHVGMDTYTFCEALGPLEGNKQLRRHWSTWVTEQDIRELYMANIDSLRVPVGDWMWRPYGP